MTKKKGATTTDLEVAVKEGGEFKSPKAVSRAMKIARDKLEKEGIMSTKPKTTRKPKKSEHTDEIAQLRTDIAGLRKQMKSLDSALKKEQLEATSRKRAIILKKLKVKSWKLAKVVGYNATFPIHSPIKSAKGFGHGAKVATVWCSSVVKQSFSWLAKKVEKAEVESDKKLAEGEVAPSSA